MEKKQATIEVQPKLYGLEAVYKACYTFLDRAYIRLQGDPEGFVSVVIRAKDGVKTPVDALAGEFENELLHQALRVKVAEGNRKIREYIVTRALLSAQGEPPRSKSPDGAKDAGAPLLDAELEKEIEKLLAEVEKGEAAGSDPLKITVPWDEKKGAPAAMKLEPASSEGGCCGSGGGHRCV
jgi:His-Xaa-Ser system protein HxsD